MKKLLLLVAATILLLTCVFVLKFAMVDNIKANEKTMLYIPSDAGFNHVLDSLNIKNVLINSSSFKIIANLMKYDDNVKPGRYELKEKMNNIELVRLLRSGNQKPVNFTFIKVRKLDKLCSMASKKLELDSVKLYNYIYSKDFKQYTNMDSLQLLGMFIPNTYQFKWNTSEEKFAKRMFDEYLKFWNETRKGQAELLDLSTKEIVVIASIVEEETENKAEKPDVASVYYNRVKNDWPLEADPTLKFALGDFSLKRIYGVYTKIESPFNTYKYPGLPPGPICTPSTTTIDAVLNLRPSKNMFFCAKPDFSGTHQFAVTLKEHNQNAARYHAFLNQQGIR